MHDSDIVIINGARTPIGRFGGSLKDLTVIDLAVTAMTAAMENSKINPDQIDEVIIIFSYKFNNIMSRKI